MSYSISNIKLHINLRIGCWNINSNLYYCSDLQNVCLLALAKMKIQSLILFSFISPISYMQHLDGWNFHDMGCQKHLTENLINSHFLQELTELLCLNVRLMFRHWTNLLIFKCTPWYWDTSMKSLGKLFKPYLKSYHGKFQFIVA